MYNNRENQLSADSSSLLFPRLLPCVFIPLINPSLPWFQICSWLWCYPLCSHGFFLCWFNRGVFSGFMRNNLSSLAMNIFSSKTESLYVTLAVLEWYMHIRLDSSFQSLPSAGVKAGITLPGLVDDTLDLLLLSALCRCDGPWPRWRLFSSGNEDFLMTLALQISPEKSSWD